MKPEHAVETIRNIFEASCIELFESKGFRIAISDDEGFNGGVTPTSIIDGGSDDYELLLGLRIPFHLLEITYPADTVGSDTIDEKELEDWLNELANLLLGVLKGKLIEHDSKIQMGLPNYFYGDDANTALSEHDRYVLYLECENDVFEMSIAIETLSSNIQLAVIADSSLQANSSGELEFF